MEQRFTQSQPDRSSLYAFAEFVDDAMACEAAAELAPSQQDKLLENADSCWRLAEAAWNQAMLRGAP